uniref:AT-rich interactive domain-containing protein 5A isoform X1 n=2 Tax=Pogona vitticeps TaxID=103695 RepID=A0ABM5EQ70_9SAUR
MAPSFKGKRKKKRDPMAESESQKAEGLHSMEDATAKSPELEEPQRTPERPEPVASPPSQRESPSEGQPKVLADDSGDEQMLSGEKEEEQTFLVNLYKFMKDRHTPIERVPHLGFKQINLFKIYKVVEKLGAYELVTGRRLWKNVYDMLGGSPGSTSAATCTRRHYERLVLPYVRHLKGEDDKPLPPVKPRKQYKVSKEPKGDKGGSLADKKRARKEKARDHQVVLPEKQTPEVVVSDPKPGSGFQQQNRPQEQTGGCLALPNGQETPESQTADSCRGNCRAHSCSETYKRLFSSFYFKGNHGIMSPLAKKKLLAQVSKDEALYCHEKHLGHCPEYKKARSRDISGSGPEAGTWLSIRCHKQGQDKEVVEVEGSGGPGGSSPVSKGKEGTLKVSPNPKDSQGPRKTEDSSSGGRPSPDPPAFGSSFCSARSDVAKPGRCHHPRAPGDYYPGLRDAPASSSSSYQPLGKNMMSGSLPQKREGSPEDQPEDLRRRPTHLLSASWRGESQPPSAFQKSGPGAKKGPSPLPHLKPSWVSPAANLAKVSPQISRSSGQVALPTEAGSVGPKRRRAAEEDFYRHGKKLKAVSPFMQDMEPGTGVECSPSPKGPQGVAKPKATVASRGFPVAPVPQVQDMYKGMMVRLPVNFSGPGEPLKGQSPSLHPSLSISPFIIPAFPTPLLTASVQPSDLCQPLGASLVPYPTSYDSTLRHGLYPLSPWHSQPAYAAAHIPAFHRNAKL